MQFVAEAEVRTQAGKGAARQIRRMGKIPGVVYGQGRSSLIQLDPKVIQKILIAQAGSTGLISLNVHGIGEAQRCNAVIQDVQRDPVEGFPLHVDLLEVSMDKPVRVKVPVHVAGSVPIGVKRDHGVLNQATRELHVECLPHAIPDAIKVDASELGMNQGIHVRDVQVGEGLKILDDPDGMVVNVAAPISEAKLSAMLTTDAAAPSAETSDAAPAGEKSDAPTAAAKPSEPKK